MRILILGGNGMLGHCFLRCWQQEHDVKVTLHRALESYSKDVFQPSYSMGGVDAGTMDSVEHAIDVVQPDAVVNAIGVTKQCADRANVLATIEVNALFPHRLASLCGRYGVRVVHLSTDCVFSGKRGFYDEHAVSDAEDMYGRSKFLGEIIDQPHVITLRKSTIGLELAGAHGLVEWFLSQRGETVRGYRKAIYSGLISSELASVIEMVLLHHPQLHGVWNVASSPINKYDLLSGLLQRLGYDDIQLEPYDDFICDRSLDGTAFRHQTGYVAPSWDVMLDSLALQINRKGS